MKTSAKTPFSYVALRYVHDVFTREFVNVAILLYSPQTRFLGFKRLPSLERVKGMFPGLRSDSLRDLLRFLESRTDALRENAVGSLDRSLLSAESIGKSLLPTDDSALQWSTAGGGITQDPQQTLNEVFERLVTHHLRAHPPVRREDGDVWKPFERELRQRDVLYRLQDKVLTVGELHHRFENTWQPPGGYLRLFQPLSFDLLEPSNIVEKAVHWAALIHQLRKADPEFFIYLLVGRPSGTGLSSRAFQQAYETLSEHNGGRKELVPEEDAPRFGAQVEREINTAPNN